MSTQEIALLEEDQSDPPRVFGMEIARRLSEMKSDLIVGVVEKFGRDVAAELFAKTQEQLIPNLFSFYFKIFKI